MIEIKPWNGQLNMECEDWFEETLKLGEEEKKEYLDTAISCWLAYDDGKIVGESYVTPLDFPQDDEDLENEHFQDLKKVFTSPKVCYWNSTGLAPEYRGKGIGAELKLSVIKDVKSKGYEFMITHARQGASCKLNQKVGGVIFQERKNWYDTGESYFLMGFVL